MPAQYICPIAGGMVQVARADDDTIPAIPPVELQAAMAGPDPSKEPLKGKLPHMFMIMDNAEFYLIATKAWADQNGVRTFADIARVKPEFGKACTFGNRLGQFRGAGQLGLAPGLGLHIGHDLIADLVQRSECRFGHAVETQGEDTTVFEALKLREIAFAARRRGLTERGVIGDAAGLALGPFDRPQFEIGAVRQIFERRAPRKKVGDLFGSVVDGPAAGAAGMARRQVPLAVRTVSVLVAVSASVSV